jgi:general secretion pathway protein I
MESESRLLKAKHRRRRNRQASTRGFTLLEVMIALVIFATLAGAVITASHYSLRQNARLQEQVQCAWVADNQLSELRLQAPTSGRQQLLRRFDGRDWVIDQTITPATDPRLLKVDISVSPAGSDQAVYRTQGWIPAVHE